jgi:alkyl hydroperoxide reductase subunit AhpF
MALLSDQDHQVLSERFAETLEKDVMVKLFTQSQARSLLILPGQDQQSQSNEFMKVTQELLEELTSISPKLTLQVYDVFGDGADEAKRLQIEQLPAIVLGDDDEGRVRFYGAPVGNEFPTILTGIEALSKSGPMLTEEVAKVAIERIDEQVHLRVFVTPT